MANPHRHTELEVLRAIKKLGASTNHSIALELNLSNKWIEDKTHLLYQAGRIYISDWQKKYIQGPSRPMFSIRLQDEEDAPRPAILTPVQKTQNYRKRLHQRRIQDALTTHSN